MIAEYNLPGFPHSNRRSRFTLPELDFRSWLLDYFG